MFATRYLPVVGRPMIGLPFVMSGLSKLGAFSATTEMISAVGLPSPPLAFAVAVATEFGGGLLLIAGYRARYAAAALALFSLATAICERYRLEYPDERERYGDAGIAWCKIRSSTQEIIPKWPYFAYLIAGL